MLMIHHALWLSLLPRGSREASLATCFPRLKEGCFSCRETCVCAGVLPDLEAFSVDLDTFEKDLWLWSHCFTN